MTLRRSVTLDPLQHRAPSAPLYQRRAPSAALSLSPRLLLVASLFFIFAGNIPLGSDGESGASAVIRAAGLACGAGCLLIAWAKQGGDLGIESLAISLSPFAIFLAYCLFSAAWSLQPSATIIRSAETMATIVLVALWTQAAARQGASEKQLCSWIAVAVVALAFYGLFINTALFGGPIRIVVTHEESNRPRFVFGGLHPLAVGDMLAIGILATIMAGFRLALKMLALMLLMPLLYLSHATGAMLLVFVITAAYLGASTVRSTGVARAIILLPFLLMTAYFIIAIAFALEVPITKRIMEDQRIWTLTGRTMLWSAIWEAGLASTWFGTGFDAARGAIFQVFGIPYQVHNQYLAIVVELGYIGVALFIPLLVIWLVPIIKSSSLVLGCFALYVLGINMDNASMFTKTWLIFLTAFCYTLALELLSRSTRPAGRLIRVRVLSQ